MRLGIFPSPRKFTAHRKLPDPPFLAVFAVFCSEFSAIVTISNRLSLRTKRSNLGPLTAPDRDCFVARGAPRNDTASSVAKVMLMFQVAR